jgi:hypothetical protein
MTTAMPAFALTTESAVNHHLGDPRQEIVWAASPYYAGRAHLAFVGSRVGLCAIPVDEPTPYRPYRTLVCPECALGFVEATVPIAPAWPDGGRSR